MDDSRRLGVEGAEKSVEMRKGPLGRLGVDLSLKGVALRKAWES